MKIIQITDPHIDRKYKTGANAVCGAPLCCRKDQGEPKNPEEGAGIWGDYRGCDSPRIAVEDAYDQIRKQHKVRSYNNSKLKGTETLIQQNLIEGLF